MTFQDILNTLGSAFSKYVDQPVGNWIKRKSDESVSKFQNWSGAKLEDLKRRELEASQRPVMGVNTANASNATPTPAMMPTATPSPSPSPTPNVQMGSNNAGYNIPGVPPNISQIIGDVFENSGTPMNATMSAQILNHPQGQQVKGVGRGENPNFQTLLDVANRINSSGNWDNKAPIRQVQNPFTGGTENSIDRGLWRINNAAFYDYQRRFPDLLNSLDINSWEDMNDPRKNSVMAKLILQKQGPGAWFAAPRELLGQDFYLDK